MDKPAPLHQVIGRRLRALRTAAGRLQEDVAAAARAWGFDWQRGTVAMIELGRRRVTAEELIALPAIARDAGLEGFSLGEDVMVILSPLAGAPTLSPSGPLRSHHVELVPIGHGRAPDTPEAREIRRLEPRLRHKQAEAEVFRIALESHGDAETKAARVLGVSPIVVAMAAQRRFRQSLTAQRDAVAAGREGIGSIDPRRLQARRGHITRQLVEELRPFVKGITKKNITTKRRTR
jgi:transcriptional regulator with XRE-family HTH domain